MEGTEAFLVAGCRQTAPLGSGVEHHGLYDLRIDRGIALRVPGVNGARRAGPKAGKSVSAIVEQVPVPEESVPETRTRHVARVEHLRPGADHVRRP